MSKTNCIHDKHSSSPHRRARQNLKQQSGTVVRGVPVIPQQGRDVICGRGEKFKQFNTHYRKLVARFAQAYQCCLTNETKRSIAHEIYRIIQSRNGRFFRSSREQRSVAVYENMSDKDAVYKIMRALKDYPKGGRRSSCSGGIGGEESDDCSCHGDSLAMATGAPAVSPQTSSIGVDDYLFEREEVQEEDSMANDDDGSSYLNIETIWSDVPLEDLLELEGVMESLDEGGNDFELPEILK